MHHSTGNPHFVFWKKLRVAACVMEFYIDGAEVSHRRERDNSQRKGRAYPLKFRSQ